MVLPIEAGRPDPHAMLGSESLGAPVPDLRKAARLACLSVLKTVMTETSYGFDPHTFLQTPPM